MDLSRRSFVQAVSLLVGTAAVIEVPVAPKPLVESTGYPTPLEHFLKCHGIRPAYLSRESGYSRQFLLRLRMGRMLPSLVCIASVVCTCRRLTRDRVQPTDLFTLDVIRAAVRSFTPRELEPHQENELRAAFDRWEGYRHV